MDGNPQVENGYTRIANELLEAICKQKLSPYEFQILLAIIRKTYGYQKKADYISLSQLSSMTDIPPSHCSRTLKKLKQKNIIIIEREEGKMQKIQIQKKYKNWQGLLPIQVIDTLLPEQVITITQAGNRTITYLGKELLPEQVSTKERKKYKRKYINKGENIFSYEKDKTHLL